MYVRPPEALKLTEGNPSATWQKWKVKFEIFLKATGSSAKDDPIKVGLLLNHIGDDGLEIYSNFEFLPARPDPINAGQNLAAESRDSYATLLGKFDAYFTQRDPRLMLREQFWYNLHRSPEQNFESWLRLVKEKAQECKFDDTDQMTRDKLVFSCQDDSTKLKLYDIGADLTLHKTIQIMSMREVTRKELAATKTASIDAISQRHNKAQLHSNRFDKKDKKACFWCGKTHNFGKRFCPAANATCSTCQKRGHYAVVCRSMFSVSEVDQEGGSMMQSSGVKSSTVGVVDQQRVTTDHSKDRAWHIKLLVNDDNTSSLTWCIDTGAQVSVMPDSLYKSQYGGLQPTDHQLFGPNNSTLDVKGVVEMTLSNGESQVNEKVYVVKGGSKLLLGMPAIQKFGLIKKIPGAFSVRAVHMTAKLAQDKIVTENAPTCNKSSTSEAQTNEQNVNFKSEEDVKQMFPKLFDGKIEKLDGKQHIDIDTNAKPYVQSVPRRVPVPLLKKVESELHEMIQNDIIEPVDYATDWVSPIVVVPKANKEDIRICVDFTKLNSSVKREIYSMPSVEETLSKISEGKVFSKLDAKSGFHQIELDETSSELTTFVTPFGRYKYKRLPYGICSAPEYFQKKMDTILHGLQGVVCHMDDILVFGSDKAEHDVRLQNVLEKLNEANLTLNNDKFVFARSQLDYLGYIVGEGGLKKDPTKVEAVVNMKTPENVSDLRRFLGMVNQMMKFLPNLAEKTKPLRDLLHKDVVWLWGPDQQIAFETLKSDLASNDTLAMYSPERETIVSADSSSYGLGACLEQRQDDGNFRPVAYASRSLTPTERRYAQIEKEALAITWALEHWSNYLIGMKFKVQSDHKPLIPLFSTKLIDELPIRIQRFRLRLMGYMFDIVHVAGKDLNTADTLSRAPLPTTDGNSDTTDLLVNAVLVTLPMSDHKLEEIRRETKKDENLKLVMHYVRFGWPETNSLCKTLKPFWIERGHLTVHDDLLMKGSRIIIPDSLRSENLRLLHDGHQGIQKCKQNSEQSVWWPEINKDIEFMVKTCPECCQNSRQKVEPMISSEYPSRPWQKVAADFFEKDGEHYLLIVDYYSRDVEISKVSKNVTALQTVSLMKKAFSRHGICDLLMTDNGPQFSADCFKKFAASWGFEHVTSSPLYPQSNGEVERCVQTIKMMMTKCDDEYLGLMMYRNSVLANGFSPAQLSMGRRIKTRIPCHPDMLLPSTPNQENVKQKEEEYRKKMKENYDKRHRVQGPETLGPGDTVWIPDKNKEGNIVKAHEAPRSLIVETEDGSLLRRNRGMLRKMYWSKSQDKTFQSLPSSHQTRKGLMESMPIQKPTLPDKENEPQSSLQDGLAITPSDISISHQSSTLSGASTHKTISQPASTLSGASTEKTMTIKPTIPQVNQRPVRREEEPHI